MSIKRKEMTSKRKREKADSISGSGELSSLQRKCFSLLEEKRKEFARAYGFSNPEYILQSSTIVTLSRIMPTSRDEMLNVDGVTENKFTQFGNEFLDVSRMRTLFLALDVFVILDLFRDRCKCEMQHITLAERASISA